jgi:hypothetical protein
MATGTAVELSPEKQAELAKAQRVAELQAELDTLMPPNTTLDKFGRMASERTITLEVDDAERVGCEVDAGKHQTFDDALHYIIERGIAEIKRQRDSLAALKEQRNDAKAMKALRTACANNPAVMDDPAKLADVLKALGIKLKN